MYWLSYRQWNECYLLWLLLEWVVEHGLTFWHLQQMDVFWVIIGVWLFTDGYIVLWDMIDDQIETYEGYEYTP